MPDKMEATYRDEVVRGNAPVWSDQRRRLFERLHKQTQLRGSGLQHSDKS